MFRVRRFAMLLLITLAASAGHGAVAYAAPVRYPIPDGSEAPFAIASPSGLPLWQVVVVAVAAAVIVAVAAFVAGARAGRHHVTGAEPLALQYR